MFNKFLKERGYEITPADNSRFDRCSWKSFIKKAFFLFGYDVRRTGCLPLWQDPVADISRFISPNNAPVVFDVGANIGQSVQRFKAALPECCIHSFEPGYNTFEELKRNTSSFRDVTLNRVGVGRSKGVQVFNEYTRSDWSSFLQPDDPAVPEIARQVPVNVVTLDEYCSEERIHNIDILKVDTQGYDLEVLEGSAQLLKQNRVHLLLIEFNFVRMYCGQPSVGKLLEYLANNNFVLVSLYNVHRSNCAVQWCDALFLNEQFQLL